MQKGEIHKHLSAFAKFRADIAGDSSHEVPSHDANEFYAVTRRRSFTCQVKNAGQCHDELVSGVLQ
jgi:hypothetical protein